MHYGRVYSDTQRIADLCNRDQDYDIVNLGSNQPKFAFDYSEEQVLKGANWAVGPQTFEYDYKILRQHISKIKKDGIVIIPICPLKFFLYRQDGIENHIRYYKCLNKENVIGHNNWDYITKYKYPLLFHPWYLRYLFRDRWPDKRLNYDNNPLQTIEQLEQDALFWINVWNKEFSITLPIPKLHDENKKNITINISLLKNILILCKENGIHPVLAILPTTDYLYNKLGSKFIKEYVIKFIDEANTYDAPLLNYSNDDRFKDPSLYINSFFFNKEGRKLFTKTIIKDIKNIL